MIFSKKKKTTDQPPISRKKALLCRPLRNPKVREIKTANGIRLEVDIRPRPLFSGLSKWMSSDGRGMVARRYDLDPLGTVMWKLINGRNSVQDIVDHFRAELGFDHLQAEQSVSDYLRTLGARELIGMQGPGQK